MAEGNEQSWRERGREAARRATEPLATAADAISGRGIEKEVAQYSEVFTQVALGLHEDLTAATRQIGELESAVAELRTAQTSRDRSMSRLTKICVVAMGALAIAITALGVGIWALI